MAIKPQNIVILRKENKIKWANMQKPRKFYENCWYQEERPFEENKKYEEQIELHYIMDVT